MTTHELKTEAPFFDAVASGAKTFEIRYNDRGYQAGDVLVLRRIYSNKGIVTYDHGTEPIKRRVTYVLAHHGLITGYVALGLAEMEGEK